MADIGTTKEDYAELNYHLQMEALRLAAELKEAHEDYDVLEGSYLKALEEIESLKEEVSRLLGECETGDVINTRTCEHIMSKVVNAGGDSIIGEQYNVILQVKALREFYDTNAEIKSV